MRKILVSIFFGMIFLASLVFALNLEFTIGVPDKIFYPNETIPINVSVINRETSFSARDVTLGVYIGKRSFLYELNDVKASNYVLKEITLPEFPSGDYIIKGQLNYTGFFDERTTIETYNSFHVRFPEMERLPRNIVIKSFSIPENITAGESYSVSITVSNEGNVASDLIVGIKSLDVDKSKQVHLEPGESDTVSIDVAFYNSGVSNVEARVYAVVNDVKYLLSFDTTIVFVKESKVANLLLDKIELVDESDNEINQNDMVKLKIGLLNNGTWLASNVKGNLKSPISEIEVIQSEGEYGIIPKNGFSNTIFEIKTSDATVGSAKLTLDVSYTDGFGDHSITFEIPLTIAEGSEACKSDNDCSENQMCSNNRCIAVPCECGEVINHQCKQYACCSDLDCEEGYICSSERHVCEPSQEIKADVLIVTSNKLKPTNDFTEALREYRTTILAEGLTSFYVIVDSQKVQELFNIQPADSNDWRSVKNVLDKIIYKVEPEYLLILGGVDIIPQPPAKTDAKIPTKPVSDDRYVDLNLDGIPDISVGRMPSPSGGSIKPIIESIKSATNVHKRQIAASKIVFADTCGTPPICMGLLDVNHITNILFNKNCYDTDDCKPNPPYCTDFFHPIACSRKDVVYDLFSIKNFIFIDAHGEPYSFASHASDGNWYTLISSSSLYNYELSGNPVISTVACHSGTIDCEEYGCINEKGSVFSFLANGASAYIANTRYGYFGISAKLIGKTFENLQNGDSLGVALLKMKQEKLSGAWSDWYKAVIYEIQLYGDPTIKLIGV